MFEKLYPLVTYCALMAATPGPNTLMLTSSGANFGFRRTLPHLLGIVVGLAVLTLLACFGLGALFQRYPQVHQVLRIVGALYMAYLAWKIAGASLSSGTSGTRPLTFHEAFIFQAVNPKSWVRAITLATVFMPPELGSLAGAVLVSGVGLLIGSPLMAIWTMFGVAIKRQLQSPGRLRAFNLVMGASLLALAVSIMLARS